MSAEEPKLRPSRDAWMTAPGRSVGRLVLDRACRQPDAPALWVDGEVLDYRALVSKAGSMARLIEACDPERDSQRVAIFAYRSVDAYCAVLACLFAGRTYVPLNPTFPQQRNVAILAASGARFLIVDKRCAASALALLVDETDSPTVLAFDDLGVAGLNAKHPDIPVSGWPEVVGHDEDNGAYLLFTSGTTGKPKGVLISHRNVLSYVENLLPLTDVRPGDRFAQRHDMTFDPSVHDMFVCWAAGACLYPIPENALLAPVKFIQDHRLTHWFSVPSAIAFLDKLGLLGAGTLPSMRCSVFCGEALPEALAKAWYRAAPDGAILNLYGPTETTVAFTYYRWTAGTAIGPIVPIGVPFPGQSVALVDTDLQPVSSGEIGEVLMAGSQQALGYWRDPKLNAERFVPLAHYRGDANRWYRTGDLARWDESVGYVFAGRVDQQLKVRGYRVEISEIEHVVREAAGTPLVAVVGWPETEMGAIGTVVFACGATHDDAAIIAACKNRLPPYMVPQQVIAIETLPVNANGKVDYGALKAALAAKARS